MDINSINLFWNAFDAIGGAVGAIATAAAVFVAIVANHKATQSLNTSLKTQEQSKNISLLDKRVAIAKQIKNDEPIFLLTIRVLFNEEIVTKFQELQNYTKEKQELQHDLNVYKNTIKLPDGVGGWISPIFEIEELEMEITQPDCSDLQQKTFDDLCNKHSITHSETGRAEDIKVYNYKDIHTSICSISQKITSKKNELLAMIEKFISESIDSIS